MQNTLADLNNYLFEQMENLLDNDISEEKFELELKRAKAISGVARTIIDNGKLLLEAEKFKDEINNPEHNLPTLLEGSK